MTNNITNKTNKNPIRTFYIYTLIGIVALFVFVWLAATFIPSVNPEYAPLLAVLQTINSMLQILLTM